MSSRRQQMGAYHEPLTHPYGKLKTLEMPRARYTHLRQPPQVQIRIKCCVAVTNHEEAMFDAESDGMLGTWSSRIIGSIVASTRTTQW